ncbi:Fe-S cluster assembly protein SufB [Candidatus Peregrinibacteria bacterium]|nr:Fe-S cluster assembly protein SufB [Candidatus Peregrinibacteria bacterium]
MIKLDKPNPARYIRDAKKGLSRKLVEYISRDKKEPQWMLEHRLKSYEIFLKKPMPDFGPNLSELNFDEIIYYAKPGEIKATHSWKNVPQDIKRTFERLGIPEAERKYLAGAGAQYESQNVYHNLKEKYGKLGIIFEDMDKAAGVTVDQPLQAYFRMNAKSMGQFEHTLIIVEAGAQGIYIEGCSAPKYDSPSLHAGLVEIFVGENARFRYSSVENWSRNTYNLNTKRAIVQRNGIMEWVSGNMGSKRTMLYPCSILRGEGSRADHLGIAFANGDQIQDTGAKVIHAAKNTSSKIVMKSISKNGGESVFRGMVKILRGAKGSAAHLKCDSLLLDGESKADTIPALEIDENDVSAGHEATVGKISDEQMFYCASRGIESDTATGMIVNGFIEPIVKELPLEYAVEMNRLIELEMEEITNF